MNAKIKEIFISTQGEGPFIGYKQLFIRFCGCNLHCNYCDTDFTVDEETLDISVPELLERIKSFEGYSDIHSISLTGGEPLLWSDFLKEFLAKIDKPVYLETNATVNSEISKIFDYIDYVAADIKLPGATGLKDTFELHDKFFKLLKEETINCAVKKQYNCDRPHTFAKIVFDENITDDEIEKCVLLAKKYNLPLVLQPKMAGMKLEIPTSKTEEIFDKFLSRYKNVRLIPQVHKFLNIR